MGDYPLQIMAAMKGCVHYLSDTMSVYRVDNSNSWVGKQRTENFEKKLKGIKSEVEMLQGFARDYPTYNGIFRQRLSLYINNNIPDKTKEKSNYDDFVRVFHDELASFDSYERLDRLLSENKRFFILRIFRKIFRLLR